MKNYRVSTKSAKGWAKKFLESYKETPEYAEEQERYKQEFQDYVLYGVSPPSLNKELIDEILKFAKKKE